MILEKKFTLLSGDGAQHSTLAALPDGPAGVATTLNLMVRLTKQFSSNEVIRDLAEQIIADVPPKDYRGEIAAIQQWVKDHIRYTRDVWNVETLKTPLALLQSAQGDCDDQALLVAALAASIGFEPRFHAIGFAPFEYEHVFAEVKLGPSWVSVETTEPVPIGWIPATPDPRANMIRHL